MIYDKFLEDYCKLKLSIAIFMNKMFELNIDLWMYLREETLQNKVNSKIILTIFFEQTMQVTKIVEPILSIFLLYVFSKGILQLLH